MVVPYKLIMTAAALFAALAVGYSLGVRHQTSAVTVSPTSLSAVPERKILYYRNPMGLPDTSPTPKQDSMGMDYVPVYESEVQDAAGTVRVSAERVQRLGVRTEAAERRALARSTRAVGTVQIDETRQTIVAPRFEGWVVKLHVNATGLSVRKGDALLDFYSPQINQIETEYLTLSSTGGVRNGSLERLATLAVPDEEIKRLQRERRVNPTISLRVPVNAVVMEKLAIEGMKFAPGDALYRLADLSTVWFMADIYEQDLAQIAIGQTARVAINALPGKDIENKIAFIYPNINPATRTAKIRIDLENADGLLRTDMYGSVYLTSPHVEPVLTIPSSAVLNSGQSKIVFIDRGEGLFQPHAVTTGAEYDGYTEITDGLSEGDRVVTSSSFLIDAESNIRAALQSFTAPEKQP